MAMEIFRFGADDSHPSYHDGIPDTEALTIEVGRLLHCIDLLGLDPGLLQGAKLAKEEELRKFGPGGAYLKEKRGQ